MFRKGKVKAPKVPRQRKPLITLPKGSVWVSLKAAALMVVLFMLGAQYETAVATGQVHRMKPVIVGTLVMCAAVVVIIQVIKYIDRDMRKSSTDKRPIGGMFAALALLAIVGVVAFHVVHDSTGSTVPWNEATGQAGVAAGLAIALMALFVWSIFHVKKSSGLRGRMARAVSRSGGHDDHYAEHETGALEHFGLVGSE